MLDSFLTKLPVRYLEACCGALKMKKLKGFVFISMLLAAWTNAQAADIQVTSDKDLTIVSIEGELKFRDEEVFTERVLRLKEAVVVFDSIGGNLNAGIEIGKAIRLKGFSTLVLDDTICASACALAWLGGKTRWAAPRAKIAFHAAWMLRNGRKEETGQGNALVGAYLQLLGLPQEAILFITKASPDDAELLTFQSAEILGIAVKRFELPSEPKQTDAKPELPQRSVSTDPDAGYYDPNARTLNPVTTTLAQPAETKTAALPPVQTPTYAIRRPEDPLMDPQVLDLANLDAAAQVQRRLQERGFFYGLVDGVWGQRSRIALRDFKIRNGLGSDDRWDLRTQLAVFDDRYPAAPVAYTPANPEQDTRGLFMPFAPPKGATLHPLNPRDALKIQSRLSELNYYRKTGDGVWGMASRSALTDFKVANGLSADDVWDGIVEEKIEGPYAVPATETPFGEWVLPGTACGDPNNAKRLVVASKSIVAGTGTCELGITLQRSPDGWRGAGVCTRGAESASVRVQLQLLNGRLVDRSVIGTVPNEEPAVFTRCQ
ncbi:hypothetical protein DC522_11620 [Microvirga sp. KLBC 81]|uniref:hypothetical protein n=1 Tax=Microvirga sp. KLBC 81 TaxID=1862707 RepID=UPI000D51216F|nr:hypothetical protein [Microvirga sp. KLBC 81]PVE24310.1 hypothetical protein DC522_11620 [Microvirga sp. KLBC 81]